MNKHKIKKVMMTLFALVILVFTFAPNLYASSISINGSTNLTVGGSTTITISGSDITGGVNISTSNSGVVSISKSSEWIESNSFTLTATAKSAGTAVITVTPFDVSNSAGQEVSVGSKSLTITVKAPQTTTPTKPTTPTNTTNSNANLKKLVPNYEGLSPNFNPNVTKYSLIVPATADSLKLTIAVEGTGAKYWINGENNLKIGDNTVTVTVTASDGTKKTYTIIVTKANNVKQANATLANLVVDGKVLDPIFTAETLEYNIGTVSADVEKLTVLAYPQSDAAKYDITGHENLVAGENIIKIKVTAEDGVTTKEYSIKVTKEASVPVVSIPDAEVEIYNEEDSLTETPSTFKKILSTVWAYLKEFWLVLCLLLVCIIELVQIIFLYKKVNKLKKVENDDNISKVDSLITPRRRNASVDNNEVDNKEETVIDDISDELVEDPKKEKVEEEDFTDNFEDTTIDEDNNN